ncbi:hypothetical protein ACFQ07_22170 [Actinomadura adrarensis]|uniref:Uncharacterized protein n=1 Tax=Actinomadura adrarensis TaxID=1819600 RepID=A0ABW3CLU4_9ACTN
MESHLETARSAALDQRPGGMPVADLPIPRLICEGARDKQSPSVLRNLVRIRTCRDAAPAIIENREPHIPRTNTEFDPDPPPGRPTGGVLDCLRPMRCSKYCSNQR